MDIGNGPVSRIPFLVWTLPSSPPHDLQCKATTENELIFDWKLPLKVGTGVEINNFVYTLEKCSQSCVIGKVNWCLE